MPESSPTTRRRVRAELRGAVQMLGPGYGYFVAETDTPFQDAVTYSELALEIETERSLATAILAYVDLAGAEHGTPTETYEALMGLTRALEIAPMTVKCEWHTARLWLLRALAPS